MTIKPIILLLFLFFSTVVVGQNAVKWVLEELPGDSTLMMSFKQHTMFRPSIRAKAAFQQSDLGFKLGKKAVLIPLVDVGTQIRQKPNYRLGAGFAVEGTPHEKWYYRIGLLGVQQYADSLFDGKYQENINGTLFNIQPIGRLSFTPNKYFNFQLGNEENFIGDGSRSLFLSDYGKSYPFAMINTDFWHVRYSLLYQVAQEIFKDEKRTKFLATHAVSWNVTKDFTFGIFETVVFAPTDKFLFRGFDIEYLNPMVMFRPQEYALGSADNVLLGVSFSLRLKNNQMLYGQLVLDEFHFTFVRYRLGYWANKFGGQLGWKGQSKWKGLPVFWRLEANAVRPFTYSHTNDLANYGNRNDVLAHPYGANFIELLGEAKFVWNKNLIRLFASAGWEGWDRDDVSYGSNIYVPYTLRPKNYGYHLGTGLLNIFSRLNLNFARPLTPKGKIHAFGEIQFRFDSALDSKKFKVIPTFGIRSFLWNDYRNW